MDGNIKPRRKAIAARPSEERSWIIFAVLHV